MSASAEAAEVEALAEKLMSELRAANQQLREAAQRADHLERDLHAARAAQHAAQRHLDSLREVVVQVATLSPSLNARDMLELDLADVGELEFRLGEVGHEGTPASRAATLLSGARLREMTARVALRRGAVGEPVHWRDWYGWLREAGYGAAGKKPEATFLTQIARSPLVRRSSQDGIYILDLDRFTEERQRLGSLHQQLAELPPPEQMTMIGDMRERRRELRNETAQTERMLEEMIRVLVKEPPDDESDPGRPEEIIAAWLGRAESSVVTG